MSNQAQRIIAKFGSPYKLAVALAQLPDPHMHRHPSVIYRWGWGRDKSGRGGLIPLKAIEPVKHAARLQGILLTAEDWQP